MIYRLGLCLVLVQIPPVQGAWGRLFYTPQQRAELDRSIPPIASSPTEVVTYALHHFNGEMHRDGAKTMYWINGQLDPARPPRRVKPGESWDAASGEIYSAGRQPDKE
ncbi:MAG: hypothetical protein P4L87_13025 [Formivibrio sp.]|nr:hypothetical protein [Formivibrio sp.]